jgi:hypothetical protein
MSFRSPLPKPQAMHTKPAPKKGAPKKAAPKPAAPKGKAPCYVTAAVRSGS